MVLLIVLYLVGIVLSLAGSTVFAHKRKLGRQRTDGFICDLFALLVLSLLWPVFLPLVFIYWVGSNIQWWFS